MGISSSKSVHRQDNGEEEEEEEDDDFENILSKAALARRTERIRLDFPIEFPVLDATHCEYTPFISPDHPSLLTTLPPELITNLVSHLDNRSIKNLRLTCRLFRVVKLRISRVFLSANPLNIHVLRSIADHDVYRKGIIELIYDDARLCHSSTDHSDNALPEEVSRLYFDRSITGMEWFQTRRDMNLNDLRQRRRGEDPGRPEHLAISRQVNAELSLEESWTYYQDLVRQQDDVVAHGADIEAFQYALQRFPALRRVSVTPAAHGWLFTPLYETPMIRAFPSGFNYPIPRGWPTKLPGYPGEEPAPWEDSKARWRGYCLVTKILAQQQQHHRVSEFLIDSHYLHTGLNCRIFEEPSQEYSDLLSCLQLPGLKRLHLSLMVEYSWTDFRQSLMRNALAKTSQLEHFSLETSMNHFSYSPNRYPHHERPPALQTFLPIDCWTRLQHFRLWNFPVDSADLISTLSQLPALQSLELGFLCMGSNTQRQLLEDMRDTLCWHERLTKPKVTFAVSDLSPSRQMPGRAIWFDEEVENFLYHGGENPFENKAYDNIRYDMGVVRDAYDPLYERLHVDPLKYHKLYMA